MGHFKTVNKTKVKLDLMWMKMSNNHVFSEPVTELCHHTLSRISQCILENPWALDQLDNQNLKTEVKAAIAVALSMGLLFPQRSEDIKCFVTGKRRSKG
jgi:hypothetical protein